MKKSKPQPESYSNALLTAWGEAMTQPKEQTLEQGKEAFRKHWGQAVRGMDTVLQSGDPELTREIINSINILLGFLILPRIQKDAAAGQFAFTFAQEFSREIMRLVYDKPPAWLAERAATEYEVPWLMVNGKPAPGFKESDKLLHWGRSVVKRNKSQFAKPQTRDVAATIHRLNTIRRYSSSTLKMMFAASDEKGRADLDKVLRLPPLSQKTKGEWWPIVRDTIRRKNSLTAKERDAIRETVVCETDATVLSEYVNNYCRKAFDRLCPPD